MLEIVALIAFSKNYFALMAITTYVLAALLFGPAAPTLCPPFTNAIRNYF